MSKTFITFTTHPSIFATIEYAASLHSGQFDHANVPYITHPLAVMRRVDGRWWHVAVLHDVVEDCGVTFDELSRRGYHEWEVKAIDLLTRPVEQSYPDFIDRIAESGDRCAIEVKLADIEDNLSGARPTMRDARKTKSFGVRYIAARDVLRTALSTLTE